MSVDGRVYRVGYEMQVLEQGGLNRHGRGASREPCFPPARGVGRNGPAGARPRNRAVVAQPAEPEAGIGLPRAGALPNQQNNALRSKAWADATGVTEASRGETRLGVCAAGDLRHATGRRPTMSHVSGRLRRSAGRGGFSVVGEQMTKFGPRGPHGPPETAMRIDLSPL